MQATQLKANKQEQRTESKGYCFVNKQVGDGKNSECCGKIQDCFKDYTKVWRTKDEFISLRFMTHQHIVDTMGFLRYDSKARTMICCEGLRKAYIQSFEEELKRRKKASALIFKELLQRRDPKIVSVLDED